MGLAVMDASCAAQSDDQLVVAVRGGDDRAYEVLYARYQRRIAAYVLQMVHDHGRAEDLTQDIFVSALRRMRATDRPIAFKPWIYEIAKNACIDQYRRSRRAEEVSFDGVFETGAEPASPAATPEAVVDAKQQLTDLCGAFGGLSDTHHRILVLRELEGRSYAEIGKQLGMTRPAVESTLFRARRRLTEEYGELVSGERCRSVQQILGTGRIGRRDERRVARHVAHCDPCRRHAAMVGHPLAGPRRTGVVARVAALLPLPAFLRRGSFGDGSASLASWSQSAVSMAEPAMGWGKALAAGAAVLAGAGAGAGAVVTDTSSRARLDAVTAGVHASGALADRGGRRATSTSRPRGGADGSRAAAGRQDTRPSGAVAVTRAQAGSTSASSAAGGAGSGGVTVDGDAPRRAPAASSPALPAEVPATVPESAVPATPDVTGGVEQPALPTTSAPADPGTPTVLDESGQKVQDAVSAAAGSASAGDDG